MLDGKVLAAVFASLAAIAAALNGGGLDASQLESNSVSAPGDNTFNSFDSIIPDSLTSLGDLFSNPEPTNDIYAEFRADEIEDTQVSVSGARLTVTNLTSFGMDHRTVTVSEGVIFYGFDGSLNPGSTTGIDGTSQGFLSEGVNVSGRLGLSEELDTPAVRLEDVRRSSISLDAVTGSYSTENASSITRLNDTTEVQINSFSGDLRIYPGNGTFVFDGMVDRLEAGNRQYGG